MPIFTLAPELLYHILGSLDEVDLENGSLVCHDWLAPCREIYWGRMSLCVPGELPDGLFHVIRAEKTNIPRHLGGLMIDETESVDDRDDEVAAEWHEKLSAVMNHFTSISKVNIGYLKLKGFPGSLRGNLFRPGVVTSELAIQHLGADKPSDVASFILQNPRLKILKLRSISFSNDNINATDVEQSLTKPVQLNSLSYLSIHGKAKATWSGFLSFLMKSPFLENLKTIVVTCHDDQIVTKLLEKASPSLLSLALRFDSEDKPVPDLSQVRLLRNLSIDLSGYPSKEWLFPNLVRSVLSWTKLERVFINCGPFIMEPDKQIESHLALWEELDVHLSQLSGLQRVTFIMVLDPCMGMFLGLGHQGGVSNVIGEWKNDLLQYAEGKLPSCREKGLVEVVQVAGSWIESPFANMVIPN